MHEFKRLLRIDAESGEYIYGDNTDKYEFKIRGTEFEIDNLKKVASEAGVPANEAARVALFIGLPLVEIYVSWRRYVVSPVKAGLTDDYIGIVAYGVLERFWGETHNLAQRLGERLSKLRGDARDE